MAKIINHQLDHQYIGFTRFMQFISSLDSYTFGEMKAGNPTDKVKKAVKQFQVTKLRRAIRTLIDQSDLEPVYEVTKTLLLTNPRYEFNALMNLLATADRAVLDDNEKTHLQAFIDYYKLLSDDHVLNTLDTGDYRTLSTPLVEYLTKEQAKAIVDANDDQVYVTTLLAPNNLPLRDIDSNPVVRVDHTKIDQEFDQSRATIEMLANQFDISQTAMIDLLRKTDLTLNDVRYIRQDWTTSARLMMAFDEKQVRTAISDALTNLARQMTAED